MQAERDRVPVDPALFVDETDPPRLRGGECADCATVTFPFQDTCPRCCGERITERALGTRGRLWTWTIQAFAPKLPYRGPRTPDAFRPYGVGYVELPGEVRVEAPLTVADPERLRIGMEMDLAFIPLTRDEAGREVFTFAFAPSGVQP